MIPAPAWFIALDLLAAYLPMAWLSIQIGTRMKQGNNGARKKVAQHRAAADAVPRRG